MTHALNGSYAWAIGQMPLLDARLAGFAQRVSDAHRSAEFEADDEALVVGHCMGAMLGTALIAQVAQHCSGQQGRLARSKFLNLGSPMAI